MSDQNLDWDEALGAVEKYEATPEGKKSNDFEALPKGPYTVVVQEANKQVSQNTGKDMIKVRLQVTEGPYANRVLFSYIVFSTDNPKAMRITLDKLATFGVTREFIAAQKPSIPQIAEALVGRKAVATVGVQETGEYKGSNEVKGFRKLDGANNPAPEIKAESKPGVPNIPQPEAAPASSVPDIPLPEVPVGDGDAADPFE